MAPALSILCSTVFGAAGSLALASLARDIRVIPSKWRALAAALRALPKD